MPTNKETFKTKMDALANSINTKAGTSGAKDLDELKTAVDSIVTGGSITTPSSNEWGFRIFYDFSSDYGGEELTISAYRSNTPFTGTDVALDTSHPSYTISEGTGYIDFSGFAVNPNNYKYINFKVSAYHQGGFPAVFYLKEKSITSWEDMTTKPLGVASTIVNNSYCCCLPADLLNHSGSGSGWTFNGYYVTYCTFYIYD